MRSKLMLAAVLLTALLVLTQGFQVQGLHEPPPAEEVGHVSQALVNWSFEEAPYLTKRYLAAQAHYYEHVNWSEAASIRDASNQYVNWTIRELSNITSMLNTSRPIRELFDGAFSLAVDASFEPYECLGDPSTSPSLLLNTKLSQLYQTLEIGDGLTSYLNETTAASLSTKMKKSLVFAMSCLQDVITQANTAYGKMTYANISTLASGFETVDGVLGRIGTNTTLSEENWLLDYLKTANLFDKLAIANATTLLLDISLKVDSYLDPADCPASGPPVPVDLGNLIRIGSSGNDQHGKYAMLSIDCGGNDVYTNNAGGVDFRPTEDFAVPPLNTSLTVKTKCFEVGLTLDPVVHHRCGLALLVDLGGDDAYTPVDTLNATVGSALAGLGMLLDTGGIDHYRVHYGIGTSFLAGAGIVVDVSGNDLYDAYYDPPSPNPPPYAVKKPSLGAGSAGIGVLLDLSGDDEYRGSVDTMGWGGLAGRGLFLDGDGSDTRLMRQGLTGSGSDTATGPGSGVGEYASLGILYDNDIDVVDTDSYTCATSTNYGCFGHAVLGSIGILVDQRGSDNYEIGIPFNGFKINSSQGFGSGDFGSVGVIADLDGSDTYSAYERVGGTARCLGVGLFLDLLGVDTYSSTQGKSFAYTAPKSCRETLAVIDEVASIGLMFDGAGQDQYASSTPACGSRNNDNLWVDGQSWSAGTVRGIQTLKSGIGIDAGANLSLPPSSCLGV